MPPTRSPESMRPTSRPNSRPKWSSRRNSEKKGGELAAPPTVLGSRDLKAQYNVTIPGAVWTYWNVLLHRRTAKEVMEAAETLTRRALDRAAARMAERASASRDPSP